MIRMNPTRLISIRTLNKRDLRQTRTHRRKASSLYLSLLAALAMPWLEPSSALANAGIAEINHVCASSTGCFTGDTAGYPVTIDGSAGMNYALTSDLTTSDGVTTGIEINASRISLDLRGFEIARSSCAGGVSSCIAFTDVTGSGIATSSNAENVRILNGSVTGFASNGIFARNSAEISRMRVQYCGEDGIRAGGSVGSGVIVADSVASNNTGIGFNLDGRSGVARGNASFQNGSDGFQTGQGFTLESNSSRQNDGDGFELGRGNVARGNTSTLNQGRGFYGRDGILPADGTLAHNVARENGMAGFDFAAGSQLTANTSVDNGGSGFEASTGSVLDGNTAHGNTASGFFLGSGVTIRNSSSSSNGGDGIFVGVGSTVTGNTTYANGGDGIQAGDGALVHRNTSRSNIGFGLQLSAGTSYRENVINNNSAGTVLNGINQFDNICNGNTTCP